MAGSEEGAPCTCLGGERDGGTVHYEDDENGCPVPSCQCDCTAGDHDGDGCCDDEDPDPDDSSLNCDSCDYKFAEKVGEIVGLFRAKVAVPSGGTGSKDWEFDVDLGTSSSSQLVRSFGVRFGGNLTTGIFWLNQPGGAVRPEQGDVFGQFLQYRATVRTVIGLCCYLIFAGNVLSAVFHPAR